MRIDPKVTIQLVYDYGEGHGSLVIPPAFDDLHDVMKMDLLGDWISDLTEELENAKESFYEQDT